VCPAFSKAHIVVERPLLLARSFLTCKKAGVRLSVIVAFLPCNIITQPPELQPGFSFLLDCASFRSASEL
jgi:hypothetical protein